MKIYDCDVNLGGPILHLVHKDSISAAEIHLLLTLHGDDSVRNIVEKADITIPTFQLYDFLSSKYGEPAVVGIFGLKTRGLKLPDDIDLERLYAGPQEEMDEAVMLADPTKAAMEAAEINKTNGVEKTQTQKRPTLSLGGGA
ncbi:MAG: hypothetical protein ACXVH1_39040 [Solirubrobacteraceae bacterium]